MLPGSAERFLRRRSDGHTMALFGESAFECPANGFLVIDDQDMAHGVGTT
jgi:hypothetical protein